MKTVIALLLCSSLALGAEPPADAPLAEGRSMLVDAGTIVPFRGVCLDEQEHVRRERINERNAATLAKAEESALISKPVLVTLILGGLVLGAAAGAGVTAWALKGRGP
jgi:hypothetical protein